LANFEKAILSFLLNEGVDHNELRNCFSKPGLDYVLKYAKVNHILFALASKIKEKENLEKDASLRIKQILEGENKRYLEMISLAQQAQNIFVKNNCHTVLMKCLFPFPYIDDDVDFVAVQQGGFSKCKKALEENSFVMIENRSYLREPLKRFLSVQGNSCLVHLHSAFSWDGVRYINSKTVWEDKTVKEIGEAALFVPSPTHDFLITAGHALFENKCVYMSDFMNIITLVESGQIDWDRLLQMANELNWKSGLVCFLMQVEALHKKIFDRPLLPSNIMNGREIRISNELLFPFILRKTFLSSFRKFLCDIAEFRLLQAPRQLFSYAIVDYFLYKRAVKSRNNLEVLYADFLQRN